MSIGLGLLGNLLTSGESVGWLQENRITRDLFTNKERKVYDYLLSHVAKHGAYPSVRTIEGETSVEIRKLKLPSEPLSYWMDRLRKRARQNWIKDSLNEVNDLMKEGELHEAENVIRSLMVDLDSGGTGDAALEVVSLFSKVIAEHNIRQLSPRMSGVLFGFPYLDELSDGAQNSDTVALVGRPGVGKSYFLFRMALSSFLDETREDIPLILNMEMGEIQAARRILSMHTHVTATLMRVGKLSHFARDKVLTSIDALQAAYSKPFYLLQGSLKSTVEDLVIRVQELKPTVLYVDGAYLLRTRTKTTSRWERVSETAEYLKLIAKEFDIPVIATYQFNRKGPGSLSNIGYSDAPGQLASIVLGIRFVDKEHEKKIKVRSYRYLDVLKGREGEQGSSKGISIFRRVSTCPSKNSSVSA